MLNILPSAKKRKIRPFLEGEPLTYDRSFKGPLENRSCTDVICLLIFIVFLGVWGFLAYYAVHNGDLRKVLAPTDSMNRKCGIDSDVSNKPYLFFFNLETCIDPLIPITGCPTPQICVEECPKEMFIYTDDIRQRMTLEELKRKLLCQTPEDLAKILTYDDVKKAIDNNRCAKWYVKSTPFLNRCVWEFSSSICPYIPTFLLHRSKRSSSLSSSTITSEINGTKLWNSTYYDNIKENNFLLSNDLLESTFYKQIPIEREKFPNGLEIYDQRKDVYEQPIEKCEIREKLGEQIIIKKMKETDTYLARFVGNFVAHFYSGEKPQEVIGLRCVPSDNEGLKILVDKYDFSSGIFKIVDKLKLADDLNLFGQNVVEDIVNSWITIAVALILAMVVSLFFIALMRWIAGPVIWFSIIGALAALGCGVYFSAIQYIYYRDNPPVPQHSPNLGAKVKTWFEDKTLWLVITIAVSVILLIIFLVVIFLRKRIVIAIALIKEGSKAVATIITSVFFPIFPWALQILTISFAVVIGLYLASIGDPAFQVVGELGEKCICDSPVGNYKQGELCNPDLFNKHCHEIQAPQYLKQYFRANNVPCSATGCHFKQIANPSYVTYMHIYNVIGFFWVAFFISALAEMILAGAFSTWYWTFHKSDVPYFTLTVSFSRTVRYHLGTVAFGALVLTICRMIRVILEYIDKNLKKFDNPLTKAILCCCKCFFWCLEKFIRFMNRNAYIMCSIHGKNFCSSAKDAFNLLMRNFLRVVALDQVTDFLFFLSKLLLTIAAGFATYYYVEKVYIDDQQLHYVGVPTAIVVLGTYFITTVFFGVYSMAVDTLFLCFLEDCERNDGSAEKPYYMSKQLMKILGKHNKIPRHQYN